MAKKNVSEDAPPQAIRQPVEGDDNWQLVGKAIPLGSERVNTNPENAGVLSSEKLSRPMFDDLDSPFITESSGKRVRA